MKPRRLAAFALALALACSGGLLVDAGNAYPCHFSFDELDAGVSECPPGWVCGVTDRCQPAADEGIPSEAYTVHAPPSFDAGVTRQLPGKLTEPVETVARDALAPAHLAATALLPDGGARLYRVKDFQVTGDDVAAATDLALMGDMALAVVAENLLAVDLSSGVQISPVNAGVPPPQIPLRSATFVRAAATEDQGGARLFGVGARVATVARAGEVKRDAGASPWYATMYDEALVVDKNGPDAGARSLEVLEVRALSRRQLELPSVTLPSPTPDVLLPIAVTRDGFYYRSNAGPVERWTRLNADDEPLVETGPVTPKDVRLHLSENGELWSVAYTPVGASPVLSTWRLERGRPSTLRRAWSDCTPCPRGLVVGFTPSSALGSPIVEVLCDAQSLDAGVGGRRSLWKVTGSSALVTTERCQLDALEPAFDLAEVGATERRFAVAEATGTGVALGGAHGQLWVGSTLSTALPLFLDRVPLGLGAIQLPGAGGKLEPRRFAVTERYVAAELGNNGLVSLPLGALTDAPLEPGVGPRALVREANGWILSGSADLVKVEPRVGTGAPLQLSFGPRVLGPRGEPSPGPFAGEALRAVSDGGVSSILVGANDSLYLYRVGTLADAPTDRNGLTPQLTPEPGFPIRSLTVDRTSSTLDFHAPPGAEGRVPQVLGYLVTSRNVFEFELSGAPLRWTQKQIVLAPNEPVEVWMDDATTSRGRVGFRDGTIFTLPGGFPLARALPSSNGGEPDRVLDYANLGGWPVALAESGLYGGVLEQRANGSVGKLLRWERIALPAELTPEVLRACRIEVMRTVDGAFERFTLILFTAYGHVYVLPALSREVGK